jgi:hypothetical protein
MSDTTDPYSLTACTLPTIRTIRNTEILVIFVVSVNTLWRTTFLNGRPE